MCTIQLFVAQMQKRPFNWCVYCVCVCCQGAAAYPENEDQQQRLREAAEGLRVATNAAAQNAIKKKLINRLEVSDADPHYCYSSKTLCSVRGKKTTNTYKYLLEKVTSTLKAVPHVTTTFRMVLDHHYLERLVRIRSWLGQHVFHHKTSGCLDW